MYTKQTNENGYYHWSIEQGDYKRDDEVTTAYQRKKNSIKRIKTTILFLIYFLLISLVTYLLIAFI